MKVLQLWKSDSPQGGGGGATSMYRLHCSLRKAGIDSQILCERKLTDSPHVQVIEHSKPTKVAEKVIKQFTSRLGLNDIYRISSFNLKKLKPILEADILHFHGIHGGFINYLALPGLTAGRPSVFTLCDMWPLTGHCAFSFDCDRWKTGCGHCPYPNAHPPIKRDATKLEWKLKDWVYSHSNLTIVSKSKWLTKMAKQSELLNRYPIHEIPNGIDTKVYQPLDKTQCRSKLGLSADKKVLMFAAVKLDDFRKGGDLLLKALKRLPQTLKKETILLMLGAEGCIEAEVADMQVVRLGFISDDHFKAICYSAADLFLFPTRAETFGNVALESIACGTPVVSFAVGGVPDIVRPGITGYLAQPENVNNFSQKIAEFLEDKRLLNQLSEQCPIIVRQEFAIEDYARKHVDLYCNLLQSHEKIACLSSKTPPPL